MEDLQTRLEETQSEIAQRRKDEKEMRGKDRAQLIQISGVGYILLNTRMVADDDLFSLRRIYLVYREAWRTRGPTMRTCRRCITLNVVSSDLV